MSLKTSQHTRLTSEVLLKQRMGIRPSWAVVWFRILLAASLVLFALSTVLAFIVHSQFNRPAFYLAILAFVAAIACRQWSKRLNQHTFRLPKPFAAPKIIKKEELPAVKVEIQALRDRTEDDKPIDPAEWDKIQKKLIKWSDGAAQYRHPSDITYTFSEKKRSHSRAGYALERDGIIIAEYEAWVFHFNIRPVLPSSPK